MRATDPQRAPTVREALLWEPRAGGAVACGLCERRCEIRPGRLGWCGARRNHEGRLFTLAYGDLAAVESRPIEIKPFFHYWPGSTALTYATWSCNLACAWCQNHALSRRRPDPQRAQCVPPAELVTLARAWGDRGLCASFTEPTLLFEHCCDTFPLARAQGLYCCFVSNGRMTAEALALLAARGLDALKVDIKGPPEVYGRFCGADDGVAAWERVRQATQLGLHVEVVNLIVPGVNDDDASLVWLIERHLEAAGPETPLHFTRYFPAHRFTAPPTQLSVLERAYRMARDAGVDFAYLGNVPGHPWEDTRCPACGTLLLQRHGPALLRAAVTPRGTCPRCERPVPLRGHIAAGCARDGAAMARSGVERDAATGRGEFQAPRPRGGSGNE